MHLLPVFDFGSVPEDDAEAFNWGLRPGAVQCAGGILCNRSFPRRGTYPGNEKEMVQALHKAGIGVIMDVVYNHTYNLDSPFQKHALLLLS